MGKDRDARVGEGNVKDSRLNGGGQWQERGREEDDGKKEGGAGEGFVRWR